MFYLFSLIPGEVRRNRTLLWLIPARRYLAELQRYVPDGVMPQTPVYFFDDLRLEERELLHPRGTIHDQDHLFAPQGRRLSVSRDGGPDGSVPLPVDSVFPKAALHPPFPQHFDERIGKLIELATHGGQS